MRLQVHTRPHVYLLYLFFRFFSFWTIQGVWVFVTLLPTLMLNNSTREKPIGTRDYVGWSLYAIGMIFEVIADYQKTAFKNDPNNKVTISTINYYFWLNYFFISYRTNSLHLDYGRSAAILIILEKFFYGTKLNLYYEIIIEISSKGKNLQIGIFRLQNRKKNSDDDGKSGFFWPEVGNLRPNFLVPEARGRGLPRMEIEGLREGDCPKYP